jgi:hypothetical protein
MLCLHLKVFKRLVELLVLHPLLLFLECLNFSLLLKESTLNVRHVNVCLKHFGQEVVRSGNWHV